MVYAGARRQINLFLGVPQDELLVMCIYELFKHFVVFFLDSAPLQRYFPMLRLFLSNHAPELHIPVLHRILDVFDVLDAGLVL